MSDLILRVLRDEIAFHKKQASKPYPTSYRYVFSPAVWDEWKRVEAEDRARRPPPDRETVHKVGDWWVVPGLSP